MLMRWHWPPENSPGRLPADDVGVDPDCFEHGGRPVPALGLGADLPDGERLDDGVEDPATRVERRDRVLEHHLDLDAGSSQLGAVQGGELGPAEMDRSRVRTAGRGPWPCRCVDLPHPDSPTRPRVSPAAMSRDTSDTAWTRWRPGAELDHEVVGPQKGVVAAQVGGAAARPSATGATRQSGPVKLTAAGSPAATLRARASRRLRSIPPGTSTRTSVRGPAVRSGGSSVRHRSWT